MLLRPGVALSLLVGLRYQAGHPGRLARFVHGDEDHVRGIVAPEELLDSREPLEQQGPAPLSLGTAEQYAQDLKQLDFDVRVSEDMTAGYRSMVLKGWAGLTAATEGASLDPELVKVLVDELERWTRRIAALDAGDLKLVRFFAIKGQGIRALSG